MSGLRLSLSSALVALALPAMAATPEPATPTTAVCVIAPTVNGVPAAMADALYDMVTLEIEELGVQILDPPRVTQHHGTQRNVNSAWCQAAATETMQRVIGILRLTMTRRDAEVRLDFEFVELRDERIRDTSTVTATPDRFTTAPLVTRALAHGLLALQATPAGSDGARPTTPQSGTPPAAASTASAPAVVAAPARAVDTSDVAGPIGTAVSLTGAATLIAGSVCGLAAIVTYQQLDWQSRDVEANTYALDRASYGPLVQRYQALWWSALALTAFGTAAALGGGAVVVYDWLTAPAAAAKAAAATE